MLPNTGPSFIIAFDVGRTLPNTVLSRDFFVVDGSVDLGTHIWHPPQIFLQGRMTSQCNVARQQGKQSMNDFRQREGCRRSLLERNLQTSGTFYVEYRIKFQLQCSSIFIGWKCLCRIFSLSPRNFFGKRLQ